jgi:exosome complex RNA-binding protein Csl4
VKEKLGDGEAQEDTSSAGPLKEVVKKGVEEAMPRMMEKIQKGVEAAMPGMLEKIQEQYNTQLESFKTEATQFVGKTWADVAKTEQKKIMTEVAQTTSESALKQSMSFINTNMTEMRNRVNNVIIYNVKEEPGEDVVPIVHSLLQPVADIPRSDIVKAVRLGKLVAVTDRIRERVILVTLRHEEDSKFLHNYKGGRRVELPDGGGHIWINADLTKTERDAAFKMREQRKARRLSGTAAAVRGGTQPAAPLVTSVPAASGGRIPAPVQPAAPQPAALQQGETPQSNT